MIARTVPAPARIGATRAAALFGLTVALVILVLVMLIGDIINERASYRFEATADIVARSFQQGIDDAERQLHSFVGLFTASRVVTEREFTRFASRTRFSAGVDSWMVVEEVTDADLDAYLESKRRDHGADFALREGENRNHPGSHFVVGHSASLDARFDPHGLDLASIPELRQTIDLAIVRQRVASSEEFELPLLHRRGFFLIVPVEEDDGTVDTLVAAPILVDRFVDAYLPASVAERVEASMLPAGDPSLVQDPNTSVNWITAGGRLWQVAVTPADGSDLLPFGQDAAIAVGSALAVGALAAFAAFAFVRRREAQRELEENERLNAARDQFLAAISHEIRTPLTAVVGFAGEARAAWPQLSEEERLDMLRIIDEQAREVSAIVADLLVIGRTDVNTLHLAIEEVAVADAVGPAVESLPEPERRKIRLDVDGRRVLADRGRMSQILRNLIVNACLHGGDRVEVACDENASFVHVRVSDDGAGIPEEFAQAVFDPYFSVTNAARPLPSVGLGLFVARRLAEAMGGSLEYRREDGRTVFDLALPTAGRAVESTVV